MTQPKKHRGVVYRQHLGYILYVIKLSLPMSVANNLSGSVASCLTHLGNFHTPTRSYISCIPPRARS